MFNNDIYQIDENLIIQLEFKVLEILDMFNGDEDLFNFIRFEISAASLGNEIAQDLVLQSGLTPIEYENALFEVESDVSDYFNNIFFPYLRTCYSQDVALYLRCKMIKSIIGRNRAVINEQRLKFARKKIFEANDRHISRRRIPEWTHAIDNIKKNILLQERGIEYLTHFTSIENLKSILKHGFLSRAELEKQEIKYTYFDHDRRDQKLNALSFSISFPNSAMFYSYRNRYPDNTWCLILLNSAVIYTKDCAYYPTNAASNQFRLKNVSQYKSYEALNALFADRVQNSQGILHRSSLLKDQDTTDVQAEIMVFDNIQPEDIKHIFVNDDRVAEKLQLEYPYLSIRSLQDYWGFFDDRNSFRER
ncbi:DarT ssDNA thymidine ADP-ribosyltransferase family protein [Acinetobacter baumannii]|nr:DarT ssDNA thymidine ADP-ribosyltransferase family protein [Acinetobacter baumannii]MDI9691732.1 DarT ssDNA thymidine ADP-ribosyltransferase family protein [Acinetobacter baumannii]